MMKDAAIRVIETLSFTDYVSVVEFNTDASVLLNSSVMVQATDENKESLIKSINQLSAGGRTDFYKGFSIAFDIINESIDQEFTSSCHKAIMLLTDGEFNSDTYTESEFFSMVEESMNKFISDNELPPVIFSYSLGGSADETMPKQLACDYDGIWAQIEDDGDLAESMVASTSTLPLVTEIKINTPMLGEHMEDSISPSVPFLEDPDAVVAMSFVSAFSPA